MGLLSQPPIPDDPRLKRGAYIKCGKRLLCVLVSPEPGHRGIYEDARSTLLSRMDTAYVLKHYEFVCDATMDPGPLC